MDQNSSSDGRQIISSDITLVRIKMAIVQVLVWCFVFIDIFMLFTFFGKKAFRENCRYMLFAHTLLFDSIYLLLTNLVVLFASHSVFFPISSCIPLCIIMDTVSNCTPLTITAMCLERYVAICMPLRHSSISTIGRTLTVIVVLSAYTFLVSLTDLLMLSFRAPQGYFAKSVFCFYEIMVLDEWHNLKRVVWSLAEVAVTVIIILFCFVKITLAAQSASKDSKESLSKGRRTLLLHGLQIVLCTADMISPYTESLALKYGLQLHVNIRYFNFVALGIISRALSSIIYGLRDKKFFLAMRQYASCKFNHTFSS